MPPRRKNWRIPVDLETICLKSMDRDPDRRYQTAGQMAADLRRFVNRFAISARRVGVVARTVKWVRRKPAVSILLVLLVFAAGLAGLFLNAAYRGRLERIERMKEDTLLAAMSGEFARASELMDEARELGAERGWLQLMGGQIDALQGEYQNARVKLEQACTLLPDSTAAYAMLSLAYLWDGDEDNYFKRLGVLRTFQHISSKIIC